MSAFSLVRAPGSIALPLLRCARRSPTTQQVLTCQVRGFGSELDRQSFSAQGNSMSKLLRFF